MHQLEQLQRSFAVAKKDVWIYYAKGPVMVFGLIFPLFLLIAFTIGRNMTVKELFPGLMGMAIFFTSTAVGPAILPWEARSKTLERLVSSPVEVWALLLGDVFASFVFGLLISIMPLAVAVLMGVEVVHLLVFCLGMILATICGVFVPVEEMPAWGQTIASASPLTYFIDLARYSTTGISYYSLPIDLAVLVVSTLLFLVVSIKLHERFLPQRLS
jgi:ABC-2 type transport system permease protein